MDRIRTRTGQGQDKDKDRIRIGRRGESTEDKKWERTKK